MEKSYIKRMELKYLYDIGINKNQIDLVAKLVNEGIEKKLYTNSTIPYHSLNHAERVIIYSLWIIHELEKNGISVANQEIVLKSALYHDCGRTWNIFGENHGILGAKKARLILKDEVDDKTLNIIELLIETHAQKENKVNFKNYEFTDEEKKNIQLLSDILKDADALDRNRIKLFSFARCKEEYLRTEAAKKIYLMSNEFYDKYIEATKRK
ncbi:MAG: HD domain-containing protein [Bacilli bacterium]|nr:HD domain-containing protein [Bacilli bacterium]